MNCSQLCELRPDTPLHERDKSAETAQELGRFEQVSAEVIVPTFRQMMLDLQRKGHQARLQATGAGAVCLDIEIRASPARRGAIRVALEPDDPGTARVEITCHQARERETVAVDRIDVVFVVDRVLSLLRKLRDSAPARR